MHNAKRPIAGPGSLARALDRGYEGVPVDGGDKKRDGKRASVVVQGGAMRDEDKKEIFAGGNLVSLMCLFAYCFQRSL